MVKREDEKEIIRQQYQNIAVKFHHHSTCGSIQDFLLCEKPSGMNKFRGRGKVYGFQANGFHRKLGSNCLNSSLNKF